MERSHERSELYIKADKMIAKHSDFVTLDQDPNGSHAAALNAWRMYKMNVRGTQEHAGYPYEVVYPNMPE